MSKYAVPIAGDQRLAIKRLSEALKVVQDSPGGVSSVAGRSGDVVLYEADITDLQNYALVGHSHTIANVTGLQTALDGKSDSGHTHTVNFNALSGKTAGTGDYHTTGDLVAGQGSGAIALTINDGQGNSNVTFNHQNGVPDQDGNAGRIVVNTDSTTGASMGIELLSGVTGGVTAHTTPIATFTESGLTLASGMSLYGANVANWDDAYGWGDHSQAGYLTSVGTINFNDLGAKTSGTGNYQTSGEFYSNTWKAFDAQYGSAKLMGTPTGGYYGLNIGGYITLMAKSGTQGIYDDVNNDWWQRFYNNAGVGLNYNSSERLLTTNAGVTITGTATATAFSGPLTGNVTGNVTGSSGSCTGNAATATWADTVDVNASDSGSGNFRLVWHSGDTLYGSSHFYINRDTDTIYSPQFSGGGAALTGVNAAQLNGKTSTSADTASTIMERNSSGDAFARLFRSDYTNQTTMSGALAYRISTTDNYIRFCSSNEPIRTWLADHKKIDNHTALSNLQYRGKIVTRLTSGTVTAGYAVEEIGDATWPRVRHADADNKNKIVGVAITGGASGTYVDILVYGTVKLTGGHYTVGANAHAYASNTAGYITPTPSSTAGDFIKVIGFGLATDVLMVDPATSWVEI